MSNSACGESETPTLQGETGQAELSTLLGDASATLRSDGLGPRSTEARALMRGDMLGRYVVLDTLGRGGMGIVYAAYDPDLDRKVAIKLVRPSLDEGPAARQRLHREAQAIAKLSHPHVVHVHDVGVVDGRVFIAMEFIDGDDLGGWMKARKRSVAETLECFAQAGQGLAAAHEAGLVHRDFKPDNVRVGRDGRARVLDFGLARSERASEDMGSLDGEEQRVVAAADGLDRSEDAIELTVTGTLMGTPAYMSPEQFAGSRGDPRSDQFSFCVALYEALYGERPFAGDTPAQLGRAVIEGELRSPGSAPVSARLRRVLVQGLQVDPAARHPDMTALLAALARAAAPRRARWVALAALVVMGGSAAVWATRPPPRPCDELAARAGALWNEQRRAALESSFVAVDRPFAADTWERVETGLDDHVGAWAQQQQAICEATDDVPAELDQSKQECVDEGLRELGILLELFDDAGPDTVLRATKMVRSLSAPDVCVDDNRLRRRLVPADADLRERVQQVRSDIQRVRLLRQAGRLEEASEQLEPLVGRVVEIDYAPLIAEIRSWQVELVSARGDLDAAVELGNEAFELALASRHDRVAFESAMDLMYIYGVDLRQRTAAYRWGRRAEAMLLRLGEDERLRIELLNNWAAVDAQTNALPAARERFAELVERSRALDGSRGFATILNNYGGVLSMLGEHDEAIAVLSESLTLSEERLGPDHPAVLVTRVNIGINTVLSGDYETGARLLEALMPRQEAAIGADHPNVANSLESLAIALSRLGELERSEALRRRVVRIREQKFGADSVPAIMARSNLATHLQMSARYEDAAALLDALLLDLEHRPELLVPQLSHALVIAAQVALSRGRGEQALELAARLAEVCAPPEACLPRMVHDLAVIRGEAALLTGAGASAIATLEAVLGGDTTELTAVSRVRAHFALARALMAERGRREAALEHAREAQREVHLPQTATPELVAPIDAWMLEHG